MLKEMKDFTDICKMNKDTLKRNLAKRLEENGYEVINEDGFLYARGNIDILLTAHMDTVHKKTCQKIDVNIDKEGLHYLSSKDGIGGDDRCGVYMILELIKEFKPYVLFCEDEEIGGIGSEKFCKTKYIDELSNMKYLIELDRANAVDAVFYNCDNDEFTKYIEKNTAYEKAHGSFSDISNLAPECMVAAVNLSCGYYKAHTTDEYVVWEDMLRTIDVVKGLLSNPPEKSFKYVEAIRNWGNYYGSYYYGGSSKTKSSYSDYYDSVFDDMYDEWYQQGYDEGYEDGRNNAKVNETEYTVNYEEHSEPKEDKSVGNSVYEALGRFFIENPTLCYNDIIDVYNR